MLFIPLIGVLVGPGDAVQGRLADQVRVSPSKPYSTAYYEHVRAAGQIASDCVAQGKRSDPASVSAGACSPELEIIS